MTSERLLAVDPGDSNGLAWFEKSGTSWACVDTDTVDQPTLFALLPSVRTATLDYLVYERFIVEPGRAMTLSGSELVVVQNIGAIKFAAATWGESGGRWPRAPLVVHGQTNKIKRPTQALLRKRGVKSTAKLQKQPGDHAFDAELHGWYYLINELKEA